MTSPRAAARARRATETFKSSNLRLDAAGAKFLNKALGTTVFKKGENVGKFATTWDVAPSTG